LVFQKAQALGLDVGVTGKPVIRAQYSYPSGLTKYLTLGSRIFLLTGSAGTNRTRSTAGGVKVTHAVKLSVAMMQAKLMRILNLTAFMVASLPASKLRTNVQAQNVKSKMM
jgi:hypothetical protein